MGGKLGVVGQLTSRVSVPTIEAIGRGDYWSKWILFRKSEQALLNDIELSQILAVPKVVKKLNPALSVEATVSTFGLLPMTLRSREVVLEAKV